MRYSTYWSLVVDGKVIHRSGDFGKLLNYTARHESAEIYYLEPVNGNLVWQK